MVTAFFTLTGGARTMELQALHELACKNNALLARLINIAMDQVHRTHALLEQAMRFHHYPTVSASAIPTLTIDRPPTINASQAISRISDAIDLHIAALPPLPVPMNRD
jgi:hypothetical protein